MRMFLSRCRLHYSILHSRSKTKLKLCNGLLAKPHPLHNFTFSALYFLPAAAAAAACCCTDLSSSSATGSSHAVSLSYTSTWHSCLVKIDLFFQHLFLISHDLLELMTSVKSIPDGKFSLSDMQKCSDPVEFFKEDASTSCTPKTNLFTMTRSGTVSLFQIVYK